VFYAMSNYVGGKVIDCPNLSPFTLTGIVDYEGARTQQGFGVNIGYNYLGGITNMPPMSGWISPLKTTDDPTLPIYTDANNSAYSAGYWTIVPHRSTGPFKQGKSTFLWFNKLTTPLEIGAAGGNVAALDGSVRWKTIKQMDGNHWTFINDGDHRGFW
jgi:hypothetical protein